MNCKRHSRHKGVKLIGLNTSPKHVSSSGTVKQIRLNSSLKHVSSSRTDDRIRNLPKDILSYIISFLPMEDAVVTTMLSQSWRNILSSLTTLDFEYSRFPLMEHREKQFIDFISRILNNHNVDIKKFRVAFELYCKYTSHVNSWIQFAVTHHIQDLELVIPLKRPIPSEGSFPGCVFTCESLRVLKLNTMDSIL